MTGAASSYEPARLYLEKTFSKIDVNNLTEEQKYMIIFNTGKAVHNNWVDKNKYIEGKPLHRQKFNRDGKEYMMLPSELIGYDEFKKDVMFYDALAVEYGLTSWEDIQNGNFDKKLQKMYDIMSNNYLEQNNITNKGSLEDHIKNALTQNYYPKKEINNLANSDFYNDEMIEKIAEQAENRNHNLESILNQSSAKL